MTWLLVLVGGMLGAALRYLADRAVRRVAGPGFPWGTFTVNVTGCLVLGLLAGLTAADDPLRLLIGTGLCGALTTYSTLSHETLRIAESGARATAAANVLGSVAAGIGALWLGTAISR